MQKERPLLWSTGSSEGTGTAVGRTKEHNMKQRPCLFRGVRTVSHLPWSGRACTNTWDQLKNAIPFLSLFSDMRPISVAVSWAPACWRLVYGHPVCLQCERQMAWRVYTQDAPVGPVSRRFGVNKCPYPLRRLVVFLPEFLFSFLSCRCSPINNYHLFKSHHMVCDNMRVPTWLIINTESSSFLYS